MDGSWQSLSVVQNTRKPDSRNAHHEVKLSATVNAGNANNHNVAAVGQPGGCECS